MPQRPGIRRDAASAEDGARFAADVYGGPDVAELPKRSVGLDAARVLHSRQPARYQLHRWRLTGHPLPTCAGAAVTLRSAFLTGSASSPTRAWRHAIHAPNP